MPGPSAALDKGRERTPVPKADPFADATPTNEQSVDVNNANDRAAAQEARSSEVVNRNGAAVDTAKSVAMVAHYDSQAALIEATKGVNVTMAPIENVVSSVARMAVTGATVYNVIEAVKHGDFRSFQTGYQSGNYSNSQWGLFQQGDQLIASPLGSWFQTGATSGGWNLGGNGGFINNGCNNSWNRQESINRQHGGIGGAIIPSLPYLGGGQGGGHNSEWNQQENQNNRNDRFHGFTLPQTNCGSNNGNNSEWNRQEAVNNSGWRRR